MEDDEVASSPVEPDNHGNACSASALPVAATTSAGMAEASPVAQQGAAACSDDKAGVSQDAEQADQSRRNIVLFAAQLACRLRMPASTQCAALWLLHRFFQTAFAADCDPHNMAMAAVYIAGKEQECVREPRDIVNVSYTLLHPRNPPLEIGPQYEELRETLIVSELYLLRTLNFDIKFDSPHKYLMAFLHMLRQDQLLASDVSPRMLQRLAGLASSLLCDAFHVSSLALSEPPRLAVLALAGACDILGIEFDDRQSLGKEDTWLILDPRFSATALNAFLVSMSSFYAQSQTVPVKPAGQPS